jgi:hypothetical protein
MMSCTCDPRCEELGRGPCSCSCVACAHRSLARRQFLSVNDDLSDGEIVFDQALQPGTCGMDRAAVDAQMALTEEAVRAWELEAAAKVDAWSTVRRGEWLAPRYGERAWSIARVSARRTISGQGSRGEEYSVVAVTVLVEEDWNGWGTGPSVLSLEDAPRWASPSALKEALSRAIGFHLGGGP